MLTEWVTPLNNKQTTHASSHQGNVSQYQWNANVSTYHDAMMIGATGEQVST
jgi:hypothetical protein